MIVKEKLEEVEVNFLKAGIILNGIVYDEKGTMLWPAKKPMTDGFIAKLRVKGIQKIFYIPPKNAEEVDKHKNPGMNPDIFSSESHEMAKAAIDEIVHQIKFNKMPTISTVKTAIEKFFKEMETTPNGFLNLLVLKDYDTYTYMHSINVGLLSMFLTKKLGFNTFFIQELGIGGFLHDIGKIKIPSKIVNKHGNLTDEEFKIMKSHPIFGYNLIKEDNSLSNYVKKVILFHHEKWDGTGYPLRLKGEAIGNFANIVSVCDVYDALTTERSYKKPYSVNDALLFIMRNTISHFSPYISQRFINETAIMYDLGSFYPIGAFILLNTGEIGFVTAKDSEYSMKPDVSIIKNSKGVPLRVPLKVELKRDVSRVILKTIDEPEEIERLSILI